MKMDWMVFIIILRSQTNYQFNNFAMLLQLKKQLGFFLSFLCYLSSSAQEGNTLEIHRGKTGQIIFARFKADGRNKINTAKSFLKTTLSLNQNDDFRFLKETSDLANKKHQVFQQYYQGIKVEDGIYLVHGGNGDIETINGNFQDVQLIDSVTPSLNEKQAIRKALAFTHAKKYKWEDSSLEKVIKLRFRSISASFTPKVN